MRVPPVRTVAFLMLLLFPGCSQETGRVSANRNKKESVSATQEIQTASPRLVRKGGRNMQYGVCCGPETARVAARAGFVFVERTVGDLLKPREDRASFAAALEETRAAGLPCPVLNVFVPGDLKITGETADLSALRQYVTVVLQRAKEAGVRVIVFGSGAARRIPDGFDRARARRQIVDFLRMLAPIAADNGVTIAVEPLCRRVCNVLNTVRECGELVREVNHPAVRLLVDSYHLLVDGDSLEDIVAYGDLLAHVHVSTVPNGLMPGLEECDLGPFFDALARADYDGRVSIEARITNPAEDLPKAFSALKDLQQRSRTAPELTKRTGERNMQYGVCGGPEIARAASRAGFDYVEMGVGSLLKPREDPASFAAALKGARAAGLPCPTNNSFVPGDLKITGENVDPAALKQYVTTAFQRAQEAGVRVIVFGSGGARRIPDGFDRARARQQIVEFLRMLAPIAAEHGVTVAIEPLCRKECNVLNTVRECGEMAREVNHPAVRLLVDSYHLLIDRDSVEDIVRYGDLLAHVHIATVPNRFAPGLEECDLQPFFDALAKAGYTGRVSIEGKIPDPPNDLPKALSVMKELERKARNARS